MQMSFIFDARSDRWIGRVGGVEIPQSLFKSLCEDRATHYEIMSSDIRGAIEIMRSGYQQLKNHEMEIKKGKDSAAAFKNLRLRQQKQLAAINQMEVECANLDSHAATYRQWAGTIDSYGDYNTPVYVIRG